MPRSVVPAKAGTQKSGSRSPGSRPEIWIASRMKDCEYHDMPRLNAVEDGIREERDDCAPHVSSYRSKHLGESFYRVEGIACGSKESLAKTSALLLVPSIRIGQIPPDLTAEDDRQSHQPRLASART